MVQQKTKVQFGSRDHVRDEDAIKGADCELHTESVRSRARADLAARFNQVTQPMAAVHATLPIPQLYEDPPQIAGPSSAAHSIYPLSSAPPALGLFIPSLSVPSPHANGSSDLLSLPSPLAFDSRAPSPAISDITLLSLPSKRQRLTSGSYRSVSQPVTTGSVLSPLVGAHWPTSQTWTDADQADWETGLARVTASAGLPLRWVENPEWLKLCDRFIP
ncbi:hypothetical protein BDR07DRAFT_1462245 [Suillus spraguei]|nr:hypothetical protein BDR07DRAFT_1462245 [Suillus spraguei]